MLYSVPVDALRYSTAEQEQTIADAARFERLNMKWAHYLPALRGDTAESLDRLWPLRITGTCIGSLEDVEAFSVQDTTLHGLVIWAFSSSVLAKAWEVDNGQRPVVRVCSTVEADGVVREAETVDEEETLSL